MLTGFAAIMSRTLLQRATKLSLQAAVCYGISICLSVCASIRPPLSDIVSKRGNAGGCSFHYWVAQCL